jgi:transcriptional regulator with XRE-family HTH domain
MRLSGKLKKEGKFWAVESSDLQAYTQGTSKQNALEMMVDWIRSMLDQPDFKVDIAAYGNKFAMSFDDPKPILGLLFAQTRAATGLTLQQMVTRIGKGSPPNISQYETGKHDPSFTKAQELVNAMGYDLQISLVRKPAGRSLKETLGELGKESEQSLKTRVRYDRVLRPAAPRRGKRYKTKKVGKRAG